MNRPALAVAVVATSSLVSCAQGPCDAHHPGPCRTDVVTGSGDVHAAVWYEFDGDRLAVESHGYGDRGATDYAVRYVHDDSGELVERHEDGEEFVGDADGNFVLRYSHVRDRDENGRLKRDAIAVHESSVSSSPYSVTTWQYDDLGRPIRAEVDGMPHTREPDGTVDAVTTWAYVGADPIPTEREIDGGRHRLRELLGIVDLAVEYDFGPIDGIPDVRATTSHEGGRSFTELVTFTSRQDLPWTVRRGFDTAGNLELIQASTMNSTQIFEAHMDYTCYDCLPAREND